MIDHKIYSAIELLNGWKKLNKESAAYSFTIDDSSLRTYRLSLYTYGEHKEITGAYSISTSDLSEIMEKIQGIFDKCEL